MHHITSKEILEGNLKAVMRLILALAAHYKPQSVRHHDVSLDNQEKSQPEKPHQQSSGHDAGKVEGLNNVLLLKMNGKLEIICHCAYGQCTS